MSYRRHAAVDVVAGLTQLVSAVPVTDELLILVRGTISGANTGGEDWYLRPNSDSGANYRGGFQNGTNGGSSSAGATGTNGLTLAKGIGVSTIVATHRMCKVGSLWLVNGASMEDRSAAAFTQGLTYGQRWNSGGAALSTLLFKFDVTTASTTFTGRLEVWYQDS